MKASLTIFAQTLRKNLLINIFGSLFLLLWIVLLISDSKHSDVNVSEVFLTLALVTQMVFLYSWSNHLRLTIQNRMNFLLPNFKFSIWLTVGLYLLITVSLPLLVGLVKNYLTFETGLLIILFGLLIITTNLHSQSLSAVLTSGSIFFMAAESSRLKKNPDASFMDYIPLSLDLLGILVIAGLLVALYFLIAQSGLKSLEKGASAQKEEFLLTKKAHTRWSQWLGFKFLQMRLSLYRSFNLIKRSLVEISLWNNQYYNLSSTRWVLLGLLSLDLLTESFAFRGFLHGIESNPNKLEYLCSVTILITLPIIAGFDNSLFARLKHCERLLWLKMPVDGFAPFKNILYRQLWISSLTDFVMTFAILFLLLIEFNLSLHISLYFVLTFVSFKLLSIILGYVSVIYEFEKFGRFMVALIYILYIVCWIVLTLKSQFQSYELLIAFGLICLTVIFAGVRKTKNYFISQLQ